jgi:hypothetical protein
MSYNCKQSGFCNDLISARTTKPKVMGKGLI